MLDPRFRRDDENLPQGALGLFYDKLSAHAEKRPPGQDAPKA